MHDNPALRIQARLVPFSGLPVRTKSQHTTKTTQRACLPSARNERKNPALVRFLPRLYKTTVENTIEGIHFQQAPKQATMYTTLNQYFILVYMFNNWQ
jgi:hypothetical protein